MSLPDSTLGRGCRPRAARDGDEIGQRHRRAQRIDAHPELLLATIRRLSQIVLHHAARDLDALDRHGIFEVEDQRARRTACALVIFFSLSPGTNNSDFKMFPCQEPLNCGLRLSKNARTPSL
jgi:hypothetical protein